MLRIKGEAMLNPPKEIQTWLVENQHCLPSDLINSLIKAGHPEPQSKLWVHFFFKQNNPEKLEQDVALRSNGRNAEVFRPSLQTSEYFPNVLASKDLGLHPIAMNCQRPLVLHVLNVFTPEECDWLIQASMPKLTPSMVVSDSRQENFNAKHDARTSYGTYFHRGSSEQIKTIDNRLAEIFGCPVKNGESLQILNYKEGAEYKPHFDFFDANTDGGREAMKRGGNRFATIIVYLSDCKQGGGTIFPNLNLQVMPIKGSAVYFEYADLGNPDSQLTLHGGSPVIMGEKWIATKWLRQKPWH